MFFALLWHPCCILCGVGNNEHYLIEQEREKEMKIQKFQITIAVPDENDPVKLVDVVDTLRNRLEEFGAENCAVEGKEVEK